MPIKIDVKLDVDSMSDFMIHEVYTSISGIFSVILGIFNIALCYAFFRRGEYIQVVVFLLFALLILFGFPYYIRSKVKSMSDSRRLTETVSYEFSDEGIVTTTSQDSGKASWGKFKKAISKKRIIVLYDDRKQAIILPVSQMGEQYSAIVDLIFEHMPVPAVRIRRTDGKREQ